MNEYDVKRLAQVLSIQAEIEGMKIANIIRADRGESPEYNEGHFQEMAHKLSNLAYSHNEQL